MSEKTKEREEELSVYKTYMKNVRLSETLQSEIIKGAKAGENAYSLLLKAVRIVSLLTGSDVFYQQVETSLTAVYGEALGEEAPLEIELQRTEERLEKIREAEKTAEEIGIREGMQHAIRAHEKKIHDLKVRLGLIEKDAIEAGGPKMERASDD